MILYSILSILLWYQLLQINLLKSTLSFVEALSQLSWTKNNTGIATIPVISIELICSRLFRDRSWVSNDSSSSLQCRRESFLWLRELQRNDLRICWSCSSSMRSRDSVDSWRSSCSWNGCIIGRCRRKIWYRTLENYRRAWLRTSWYCLSV